MDISAATPVAAQGANAFVGAYAGTHAGAFTSDATFSNLSYPIITPGPGTAPARNDSFDYNGPLVGIHGGINFLFGPNFIAGLEGDWSSLGEDDSVSFTSAVIGADAYDAEE